MVVGLAQIIDGRHRRPGDLVGVVIMDASTVVTLASYRWIERPASRAVATWIAGVSWGSAVAGAKR